MRRLRRAGRWFTDWRNGATFTATLLVILVTVAVMHSIRSGDRAQRNARDAIAAAKQASTTSQTIADNARRRVDLLMGQIAELQQSAESNGARISELVAEVAALQEQIRQMGGRPVVTAATSTTATTSTTRPTSQPPPPTPPPNPTTTTTTTTRPPAPCTTLPIVGGCLPSIIIRIH